MNLKARAVMEMLIREALKKNHKILDRGPKKHKKKTAGVSGLVVIVLRLFLSML